MADTFTMVPVEQLKPGDLVDLLNDQYADPFGHRGYEEDPAEGTGEIRHMALEDHCAAVEGVAEETPDCTVLYTDEVSQGFPRGYEVRRLSR